MGRWMGRWMYSLGGQSDTDMLSKIFQIRHRFFNPSGAEPSLFSRISSLLLLILRTFGFWRSCSISFSQSPPNLFSPMIVWASSGKSQLGASVICSVVEDAWAALVEDVVLKGSETRYDCRPGIFPEEGSAHRNWWEEDKKVNREGFCWPLGIRHLTYLPPGLGIPLISPELSCAVVVVRPLYPARLCIVIILVHGLVWVIEILPSTLLKGIAECLECLRHVGIWARVPRLTNLTQALEEIETGFMHGE